MKIIKKRIRNADNYLAGINDGDQFYVAFTDATAVNLITSAGFPIPLAEGMSILPAIMGSISRYNANGKFTIHRDRVKETVTREAIIKDWRGNYHTVDIPYQRYPRTSVPAPESELFVAKAQNGELIITSDLLTKEAGSIEYVTHVINLFLELFRECDTLGADFIPVFNVSVTRLNWSLLPQGNYPWHVLSQNIQPLVGNLNPNRRRIIEQRLETISNYNPNFVAVGNAGFRGYVVFGFENRDFFILESIHPDNATYVFGTEWEALSVMTKEQIINQNLFRERIIHKQGWIINIGKLFR